jgi:hypothetical protein
MTLREPATALFGGDDSNRDRIANESREVISKEGDRPAAVTGLNTADDFDVVAFPRLRPCGRRLRAGSNQHREVGGGDGESRFALQRVPEGPHRGM